MSRLLAAAARAYQLLLRPLLPRACRFEPSCSDYFRSAVEEHGASRGAWLSLKRLARCQPFSPGGFDPVPRHG